MLDNLLRKHNNSHDVITFLQIFKTCELNIGKKRREIQNHIWIFYYLIFYRTSRYKLSNNVEHLNNAIHQLSLMTCIKCYPQMENTYSF